jgi:4,5-DOPA dioxygenase extradiol
MNKSLMPALFLGHGNPMYTLNRNGWTDAWQTLGAVLPRPRAILSISAHWYEPEFAVTGNPLPPTMHDFSGFPEVLNRFRYPASGKPELARRVQELIAPLPLSMDSERGLDHGTWSVLSHLYPEADIPVVQLSIDTTLANRSHYEIGQRLSPLRQEGVLILGSGNIVHNLRAYNWGGHEAAPLGWALRFDQMVRQLVLKGEDEKLIDYETLGEDAQLSIPTPDHFLPLLYILGTRSPGETVTFPVEGIDGGSLSMLAVQVG